MAGEKKREEEASGSVKWKDGLAGEERKKVRKKSFSYVDYSSFSSFVVIFIDDGVDNNFGLHLFDRRMCDSAD